MRGPSSRAAWGSRGAVSDTFPLGLFFFGKGQRATHKAKAMGYSYQKQETGKKRIKQAARGNWTRYSGGRVRGPPEGCKIIELRTRADGIKYRRRRGSPSHASVGRNQAFLLLGPFSSMNRIRCDVEQNGRIYEARADKKKCEQYVEQCRFPIESIQHKPEGICTWEHRFFSSIQQLPRWFLRRRWTQHAIIDFSTEGEVTANFTLEIGDFKFFLEGGEDPRKADSPGAASRQPPGHRSSCLRRADWSGAHFVDSRCMPAYSPDIRHGCWVPSWDGYPVPCVPVGRWFISPDPCALDLVNWYAHRQRFPAFAEFSNVDESISESPLRVGLPRVCPSPYNQTAVRVAFYGVRVNNASTLSSIGKFRKKAPSEPPASGNFDRASRGQSQMEPTGWS